ncbi:hypothetical protein JXI42_13930 [bacterium]|nr:hypothetical protein [bacterium]
MKEEITQKKDNSFLDWLVIILQHRRLLFINTIIVGLLAAGVSLLLPLWYQGEVQVLPPMSDQGVGGGLSSFLAGAGFSLGGGEFSLPMMTTHADLWKTMIESRAVLDTIILDPQFVLKERYETETIFDAREALLNHLELEVTAEGILAIRFEDKDPVFAAKLTNAIGDRLDILNRRIKSSTAKNTRSFVEEQLGLCRENLTEAEAKLEIFQTEHGVLVMDEQAKMLIQNAAQLQAELLIAGIELNILKNTYTSTHDEVRKVQTRKKEIENKLNEIKSGGEKLSDEFDFSLNQIPELTMEYMRLTRDMTIQEILYEFLVQQFEQAKIQEAKDTPVINFLSKATPPEKKYRPKRALITVGAAFTSFCLTLILVIFLGLLKRYKTQNENGYERLSNAFNSAINDILFWRKRRK